MKIRELMSSPAYTCRPSDSLQTAARLLWDHDCGMLPVVDHQGRVAAAITDRDICMGAYTRGRRLADLPVAESMSRKVVTCRAEDDISVAVRQLTQHQLHRLPVVDEQGKPCGVISLNDLAVASESDTSASRSAMKVLAAACRRRAGVPAEVPPRAAQPEPKRATAVTS